MKHLLTVLLLCLLPAGAFAGDAPPRQVVLVSEEWEGYSHADGTGMAWDIMRKIFEPAGVQVIYRSAPYSRSINLVMRGEADAWLGAYLDEVSGAYFPHHPFDYDQVSALGVKGRDAPDLASLGGFRLLWMRDYAYDEYLPRLRQYVEVRNRETVLPMLDAGRADFFVDARLDIDAMLSGNVDSDRYAVTDLIRLPMYLGFSSSAKARALADVYDRRMTELLASGGLKPIFEQWGQPYPFQE